MFVGLFAETEPGRSLIPLFLRENWLLLLPPALAFGAVYLLLPKARQATPILGGGLAATALILGAFVFLRVGALSIETLLFYAFAGIAIVAGGMMITQRNPVHAALSFALVVLSTCGLFLLQAAPFLMAATIIIYAGAIVVTFLFVIMLAQQEGPSNADGRSREPFLASLAGCVLLAALLCILHRTYDTRHLDQMTAELERIGQITDKADAIVLLGDPALVKDGQFTLKIADRLDEEFANDPRVVTNSHKLKLAWARMEIDELKKRAAFLADAVKAKRSFQGSLPLADPRAGAEKRKDRFVPEKSLEHVPGKKDTPGHATPGALPAGNVAAIGRTLFTDYLVPVEIAATLLLVATIGAIAIAGRRTEELR